MLTEVFYLRKVETVESMAVQSIARCCCCCCCCCNCCCCCCNCCCCCCNCCCLRSCDNCSLIDSFSAANQRNFNRKKNTKIIEKSSMLLPMLLPMLFTNQQLFSSQSTQFQQEKTRKSSKNDVVH